MTKMRNKTKAKPAKKPSGRPGKPVAVPHDSGSPIAQSTIVPGENIASHALTLVIAIMGFLASLTLGAMTLVQDTAERWQSDISREVTIQITPEDGLDMDKALTIARDIAASHPAVVSAEILSEADTVRLLEPWLGSDLNLDELPVPRLINVVIDSEVPTNLETLTQKMKEAVPAASIDDHRTWLAQLTAVARATVGVGIVVFVLVLLATILTVVFATQGAMSGNRHVVEVLHFVGAEKSYIASQFQRHFLILGLKGAFAGGGVAVLVFVSFGLWAAARNSGLQSDQLSPLFGSFAVGVSGYIGTFILAIVIAVLTALTSRWTVMRYVGSMDQNSLKV